MIVFHQALPKGIVIRELIPNLLKDRKALVTGASSGIGEAVARRLAASGATVVINYLSDRKEAQKVVHDIQAEGGWAMAIQADISKENEVQAMFTRMFQEFGTIDILVNNAGIENKGLFLDLSVKDWDRVMAVNLRGVFLCSQRATRQMANTGGGVIVNISSVHEVIPWGGYAHYCASKGALQMLMKTMALELAEKHIRVNNVAPGAIATPINKEWLNDPVRQGEVLAKIPWGRIGMPEDVAAAVVFLTSDEAQYITGTTLFVDGGMTLYASFLGQG